MTSNGKLFMYIDQNTVEIENSVFFLSVMYETFGFLAEKKKTTSRIRRRRRKIVQ